MNNRLLINISIRLVVAWLALSVVGILFANQIVAVFLPFFTTIIDKLSADYSPVLNIGQHEGAYRIELLANVTHPIRLSGDKFIPPGSLLTAGSHVIHTMVPIVILFTVLIAWPVKHIKQRAILLLTGIPVLFIVLGFTTPQLLAARIEMKIFQSALKEGVVPPEPFLIKWMIFVESGGRWLLPLAAAVACVVIMHQITKWWEEFNTTGTEEDMPAGRKSKKEKKQEKKAKRRQRHTALDEAVVKRAES